MRLCDIVDEAAVDLDLVERKALQIAQRGIAGAEIVECDPHPDAAKLVQDRERGFVVADQHGLGDLQLQPVRRKAGGRQRGNDLQRERAALELNRRDVDRELDMVGPCHGFRARRRQHPFAKLIDQTGVFRNRNELGGRDHATFGVPPAQQRLAAGDLVVLEADAGLVVNLQRTVYYRLAQFYFQYVARPYPRVHRRLEETIGPAPRRFGGIHRQVSIRENLIEIAAVLRRECNADARVRAQLVSETFVGLPDRIENPRRELGDVSGSFDRGLNDGEFVAAEAGHEVAGCNALAQARGYRFQQFVADQMSERVVDAFEFVDVDVEHRQLLARSHAS